MENEVIQITLNKKDIVYAVKFAFMILLGTAIMLIPPIMEATLSEMGDGQMSISAAVALPVCVIMAGLTMWAVGRKLGVVGDQQTGG